MKKSITKKEEMFLMYFNRMTSSAKNETLDFMGYLLSKTETEESATAEILADPEMMAGIKKGLEQYENGEVTDFEF